MASDKSLVCQGAMAQCQQGFVPDLLKVLSQQKYYINDQAGSDKLIGNTMDLGIPFEAGTFGQCKLQPTGSSFMPCIPNIIKWDGAYEKVELANGGQILTKTSKAICAIAGSAVIEFMTTGQMGAPSASNFEEVSQQMHQQLNPLINMEKVLKKNPLEGIEIISNKF
ncbi:DUF4280 domain-containing protein [Cellulophaga sp. E16_2]|uniref:DUF4280 domain-containing protein n=1 Tax=Cellulophaga sp. E16_2 TaxID=2789297 RepID=UPI001A91F216|nr:DUF4280 domain-containing protein [Cellulophaga sp. E16_2]MBO0593358.1 DUF4280 domain-containing protein [Cellulophaga sp. E16_2]